MSLLKNINLQNNRRLLFKDSNFSLFKPIDKDKPIIKVEPTVNEVIQVKEVTKVNEVRTEPPKEAVIKFAPAKLKEVIEKIVEPLNSYDKEYIISNLIDNLELKAHPDKALKIFEFMLSSEYIEEIQTLKGMMYYLSSSSPF